METGTEVIEIVNRNTTSERVRTIAFATLRVLVAIVVMVVLFQIVDIRDVVRAFRSAQPQYLFAGSLLLILNLSTRALKWQYMLRPLKLDVTFAQALKSLLLGISLGAVTPGEIGELGARSLVMHGVRKSHTVGLALVDRVQTFLVFTMGGVLGLSILYLRDTVAIVVVNSLSISVSLILFFRLDLLQGLQRLLNSPFFQKSGIAGVVEAFGFLSRPRVRVALLYTFIFYLVLWVQLFCYINMFARVSIGGVYLAFSAMMFVKSLLPISMGDLGIREAASVYFFALLGVPKPAALNAALLLFFFNVLLPGVIGALFVPRTFSAPNSSVTTKKS